MAALFAHIVTLIVEMIAEEPEEPVSWEDALTEGGVSQQSTAQPVGRSCLRRV